MMRLIFHSKNTSIAFVVAAAIFSAGEVCAADQQPAFGKVSQAHILTCREAGADGSEEVVRKLYKEMPFASDDLKLGKANEKVLKRYFDEGLAGLIVKYLKCDYSVGHCPPTPEIFEDGNSVVWDMSELRICAMNSKSNMVQVEYKNFGTPESVAYILTKSKSGWKIANVYYVGEVRPFDPEQGDAWSMVDSFSEYFGQ